MWCCFELAHILRSRSETCRSMQQRALHAVRQSLRAPTGSTLWPCQLAVAAGWDSRCRRAVACSSHHTVPIPLSRRPADCVEPLSRILLWRQNVLQSIQRVGDGLQQLDGGPSQQELQVGSAHSSPLACNRKTSNASRVIHMAAADGAAMADGRRP
jgi:hypothetical protein